MLPNPKGKKFQPRIVKVEKANSNSIEGILLALRYLSCEARGAGLTELAQTLKEAEVKCDQHIEMSKIDVQRKRI